MSPVRFWALFHDLDEINRLCGVSPRVNIDIAERPPSESNKPHRLRAPEQQEIDWPWRGSSTFMFSSLHMKALHCYRDSAAVPELRQL
jgi:hypothetical protein